LRKDSPQKEFFALLAGAMLRRVVIVVDDNERDEHACASSMHRASGESYTERTPNMLRRVFRPLPSHGSHVVI